jgi:hypothetical protein
VYRIINAVDESGARHQVFVQETQRRVLAGLQTIPSYSLVLTDEALYFEHGVMIGNETGIRLRLVE